MYGPNARGGPGGNTASLEKDYAVVDTTLKNIDTDIGDIYPGAPEDIVENLDNFERKYNIKITCLKEAIEESDLVSLLKGLFSNWVTVEGENAIPIVNAFRIGAYKASL